MKMKMTENLCAMIAIFMMSYVIFSSVIIIDLLNQSEYYETALDRISSDMAINYALQLKTLEELSECKK